MSQKALSIELGKPTNFMWRIESGRTLTDIITVWDIAKIVGVSPVEIMSRVVALLESEE